MRFAYNILTKVIGQVLQLVGVFNPKLKLFVRGRKQSFSLLKEGLKPEDRTIWMHVASLGEYEQGLPVLEALKIAYPEYKLVLTFFSPSGYEVKKNSTPADVVTYLPLDTIKNANHFINLVHPSIAIFIKYEVWPNYLWTLEQGKIPTLLISALFSKRQAYFKWYGGLLRRSLEGFSHIFVQDAMSKELLESIGHSNCSLSGDTRFDRVTKILKQENTLDFMESFVQNSSCFIAGSTWPEDEAILVPFINATEAWLKVVIAPHTLKKATIKKLKDSLQKKTVCYSELNNGTVPPGTEVLIIDTIGLLTKIYSYAHIAYVGGGFATGLHNTLEPAVFGIPVLIGPQYTKFKEAADLVNAGGIIPIGSRAEFGEHMNELLNSSMLQKKVGAINKQYITTKQGATDMVIAHIKGLL